MTDFRTEQSARQFWSEVDSRVDKKIAALLKTQTGITPGVEYGSAIYNTFGQAVWGSTGGGSAPFLLKYSLTGGLTVANGAEPRIDFNSQEDDPGAYVTTGASWIFEPPADAWYGVTISLPVFPSGGDITSGDFDISWWRTNTNVEEMYSWGTQTTVVAGTTIPIYIRSVLFFQASYDVNFRFDNNTGQSLVATGTTYIAIEKLS